MNNEVENPFKNIINDKKQKEEIGDTIIAFLENQKLIDMKKELKHLLIEFGYLLKDNNNEIVTLVKVRETRCISTHRFTERYICRV